MIWAYFSVTYKHGNSKQCSFKNGKRHGLQAINITESSDIGCIFHFTTSRLKYRRSDECFRRVLLFSCCSLTSTVSFCPYTLFCKTNEFISCSSRTNALFSVCSENASQEALSLFVYCARNSELTNSFSSYKTEWNMVEYINCLKYEESNHLEIGRVWSPGFWYRVIMFVVTKVSEEFIVSTFRVYMLLRNVGKHPTDCRASQATISQSPISSLWEPKISEMQ
jgi:hypothetical protein